MKNLKLNYLYLVAEDLKLMIVANETNAQVKSGFMEVAEKVGCKFESGSKSIDMVKDYIKCRINEKVKGDDVASDTFRELISQLKVEYYLNPIRENELLAIYFEFVWDTNRDVKYFTNDKEKWIEAFELLLNYRKLSSHDYAIDSDWSNPKERNLAVAIKYFKKKGFVLAPKGKSIDISDQEFERIFIAIDRRAYSLGSKSFNAFIGYLRFINQGEDGRYSFSRVSGESNIPIGYLIRLSMKYLNCRDKKRVDSKSRVDELIEFATNAATLYGVQEYSQWEHVFHTPKTILDGLRRIVLCDGVYSINQFSSSDISDLIEGFFSELDGSEYNLPWSIKSYILVVKAICFSSKYNCSNRYSASHVFRMVGCAIPEREIESILDSMSHTRRAINEDYLKPEDMEACDFQFKPLVKDGIYYDFHDKNIFSFGFYEVISSKLRVGGLKEAEVGGVFENFFSRRLASSNVDYLHAEEYKINKPLRDELGTNRQRGECDFIIETSDTILFIELKKKALSRRAQAGDVSKISFDLVSGFSASICQANWHEVVLRKNGHLKFISGKELHLKGRNIEKISVSLFDYLGLHDNSLVHQIMTNLIGQELVSTDTTQGGSLKKINRILKELSIQYALPEMSFYGDRNSPLMFDNCRFYNLFHFLEMLRNVRSSEDLKGFINSNKRISSGTRDWYSEIKNLRVIKSKDTSG